MFLTAQFVMWLIVGILSKSSFGHWYGFGLAGLFSVGGTVGLLIRRFLLTRTDRLNLWASRPGD